jgi:hypothetical protein
VAQGPVEAVDNYKKDGKLKGIEQHGLSSRLDEGSAFPIRREFVFKKVLPQIAIVIEKIMTEICFVLVIGTTLDPPVVKCYYEPQSK